MRSLCPSGSVWGCVGTAGSQMKGSAALQRCLQDPPHTNLLSGTSHGTQANGNCSNSTPAEVVGAAAGMFSSGSLLQDLRLVPVLS